MRRTGPFALALLAAALETTSGLAHAQDDGAMAAAPHRIVSAPREAVVRWRLRNAGGFGLVADDPWAGSLLAALDARVLELAACGRADDGASVSASLELTVFGNGEIDEVRHAPADAAGERVVRCLVGVLAGIDLRWPWGTTRDFVLDLRFDRSPIFETDADAVAPRLAPPSVRRWARWYLPRRR